MLLIAMNRLSVADRMPVFASAMRASPRFSMRMLARHVGLVGMSIARNTEINGVGSR